MLQLSFDGLIWSELNASGRGKIAAEAQSKTYARMKFNFTGSMNIVSFSAANVLIAIGDYTISGFCYRSFFIIDRCYK